MIVEALEMPKAAGIVKAVWIVFRIGNRDRATFQELGARVLRAFDGSLLAQGFTCGRSAQPPNAWSCSVRSARVHQHQPSDSYRSQSSHERSLSVFAASNDFVGSFGTAAK